MTPLRKRASLRSRAAGASSTAPRLSAAKTPADVASADRMTKKDKRTLKHAALMSRVQEDARISKQKRRRRPGKKLVAADSMVGGMREALDDLHDGTDDEASDEWEGFDSAEDDDGSTGMQITSGGSKQRAKRRTTSAVGRKIVMKSLKHKPGAMKRKALMEDRERERFRRNLAQLAGGGNAGKAEHDTQAGANAEAADFTQHEKWAALRKFIGTTMEKDAAFRHG